MKHIKQLCQVIIASALSVGAANADQVILDDLIVDGSACIGLDCVNGESFGFDTLRLKENNLRIRAFDTSTSASFPSNDWQITFNETSNGGANKFSIDDIDGGRTPFTIEAGTPSHSLYVDDGGRIGLGTSTPVVEIHVKDGDTPTIRLEQDGSSGFTPQTWDLAGNETNFFIRDATNGSTLPFRITPAAPTNSIFVANTGNVGFGTNSPDDTDDLAENFIEVKGGAGDDARVVIDYGGNANLFGEMLFQKNNVSQTSFGRDDTRFYIYNYPNDRYDLEINDATGLVTINNGLTVVGGCTGCDAVFQPEWELESIEEHSNFMYTNSYLKGVGPTPEGKVSIDVFQKTTGILQELEKAHIYIDQLNGQLKQLSKEKDDAISALELRLSRLENK